MECSCNNLKSSSSLLLSPSAPSSRLPHSLFPSPHRFSADIRAMKLNVWSSLLLKRVLRWETAESEVGGLKSRLSELYNDHLLRLREPIEGLEEWLDAVARARIPSAVVSSLDCMNMVAVLEHMGLMKYFQAIVAEEDGMESIAHRFISATLKLHLKPSKCVVFENDSRGITAAHNCTMMAIALIGSPPVYELVQADLAVGSFN